MQRQGSLSGRVGRAKRRGGLAAGGARVAAGP